MKNIDKIRQMSAEELAKFILRDKCDSCSLGSKTEGCYMKCVEGLSEWLNQEINPMPKLKVGDVVKTEYGEYVVIDDDNKVVNPTTMRRTIFNNISATTRFIYRFSEDEYKVIWSVYND